MNRKRRRDEDRERAKVLRYKVYSLTPVQDEIGIGGNIGFLVREREVKRGRQKEKEKDKEREIQRDKQKEKEKGEERE